MKILIIVPAFNEEKSLGGVIDDLKKFDYQNILVVNDGSKDETQNIARGKNVTVISHIMNRGLGAALGTGFTYAKKEKYDILVTFDADGQHKASDIKSLISPIMEKQADVVIGSRFLGSWQSMPWDRLLANVLSNLMTFTFYGVWSSDTQSGLRAFGKKAIDLIQIRTDRMEISSEFYWEIAKNKLKLKEIPIQAIYNQDTLKRSKQENLAFIKLPFRLFFRLFK